MKALKTSEMKQINYFKFKNIFQNLILKLLFC